MATSKCITIVQPLSVPHHICQTEIAYILELYRQREFLNERIAEAESVIRAGLKVGAVVEGGVFRAFLEQGPHELRLVISS